jgi:hypothetical protein
MSPSVFKRPRNKFVHKIVHPLASNIKFFVPIKPEEGSKSCSLRQLHLCIVKSQTEKLLFRSRWTTQNIHGLSEEKLSGAVKRKLEEQSLKVDGRAVVRDLRNQMLDVRLECIKICYLAFGKAGTNEGLYG